MSIVFEPYTGDTGSGTLSLPLHVVGREEADYAVMQLLAKVTASGNSAETGTGTARLPLRVFAFDATAGDGIGSVRLTPYEIYGTDDGPPAPSFGVASIQLPLSLTTQISSGQVGSGTLHTQLRVRGSDATTYGLVAFAPLRVYAREIAPSRFSTLYQFPYLKSFGSDITYAHVESDFKLRATITPDAVQALLDLMQFNDSYSRLVEAIASLTAGMTLRDTAAMLWDTGLLDTFIASGVPLGLSQLTLLLSDSFAASAQTDALTTILAALADSFYATMTLAIGDEVYTAWVMTPQTKAMRSYSNFPFNSFAQSNGVVFAAGPQGVYRLGGSTDAGAVISARIRSGLNDLGSRFLKRIDRAYIGYTSNGELRLRVTATGQDGTKTVYTYRMVEQPADAPRQSRVQIGRGPKSVYWAFEVCNDETGSEFELDNMTILPMVLTGKVI